MNLGFKKKHHILAQRRPRVVLCMLRFRSCRGYSSLFLPVAPVHSRLACHNRQVHWGEILEPVYRALQPPFLVAPLRSSWWRCGSTLLCEVLPRPKPSAPRGTSFTWWFRFWRLICFESSCRLLSTRWHSRELNFCSWIKSFLSSDLQGLERGKLFFKSLQWA